MKDLNKQIDDVLLFLMNAQTSPEEKSKLMMQFSKQVKARHKFKLKSQTPAKPKKSGLVNSPKPKQKKRFYMTMFNFFNAR